MKKWRLFITAALLTLCLAMTAGAEVNKTGGTSSDPRTVSEKALSSATITSTFNAAAGVEIKWKPVSGASKYVIYRRSEGKTVKVATVAGSKTSYIDTSVKSNWGKYFSYCVRVQKGSDISPTGNWAVMQRLAPLKFTTLKNTSYQAVTAKWAVSQGINYSAGYEIQYARSKDDLINTKGTFRHIYVNGRSNVSKTITGLTYGAEYWFRARSWADYKNSSTGAVTKSYGVYSAAVSVKMTVTPPAKYRALLIGENGYIDPRDRLGGAPINDINAMKVTLQNYGYYVSAKKDQSASQILSSINSFFGSATQFDVSLFYYSGHGAKNGLLCAVDDKDVTMPQLAAALKKVPGKVIVILDSCFSGSAIAKAGGGSNSPEAFNRAVINAFADADPGTETASGYDSGVPMVGTGELRSSKFYVLTACGKDELSTAYVGSTPFSAFTYGFVRGVGCNYPSGYYNGRAYADTDKNKQLTLNELYTETRRYVLNDLRLNSQHVNCYPYNSTQVLMKK